MPDCPFLIEKILPKGRIHLLAGVSSAGKSRFLIPALIMWEIGLPVLGFNGTATRWCVVCRDRPAQETIEMLTSMGFSPEEVNLIDAYGNKLKSRIQIMDEIENLKAKLVFWEGFDLLVKNPNNPAEVDELLGQMTAYCQDLDLTITGAVGVAKLKPHEAYQHPRQLVAGSSIWERSTSTNMIIACINPKNVNDPRRLLYVCLKNSPSFAVMGEFDDNGILCFDEYSKRGLGAQVAAFMGRKDVIKVWERIKLR